MIHLNPIYADSDDPRLPVKQIRKIPGAFGRMKKVMEPFEYM